MLEDLQHELELLRNNLLNKSNYLDQFHPNTLEDFLDYNDFLDVVEHLIAEEGYEGEFQVASFHPDYQFCRYELEGCGKRNRSPW